MADQNSQVPWTDEQWARVNDTIQQEASRARVAASFLPLYGPLPADTDYVSTDRVTDPRPGLRAPVPTTIADTTTVPVPTLQVRVHVRGAQMADPELTSALQLFRRAANVLARLEDAIAFRGQPRRDQGPPAAVAGLPSIWQILGGNASAGLYDGAGGGAAPVRGATLTDVGAQLVTSVSAAISTLEDNGHFGPFAVVLGQELFTASTESTVAQVMPQDRIMPFLEGGPLLRSSLLDPLTGVVVALGGAPVELVVATDVSLNFLQVTTDPSFVFRVYEKVVLRIKQPNAIATLEGALVAPPRAPRQRRR
jgi:uncharacterized linocin/CFP29 family protein